MTNFVFQKLFLIFVILDFLVFEIVLANHTGTCWAANFKSNHIDQTQFKLVCDERVDKVVVYQMPSSGTLHEEQTLYRIRQGEELSPGKTYYFRVPGPGRKDRKRRYPPDWLVVNIFSHGEREEKILNLL